MARQPDKPGEHRIREQPDGRWRVSGRKLSGERVKWQHFDTRQEAETYVARNFQQQVLDEWGLPATPGAMKMDEGTAAKFNATIGVPVTPAVNPTATPVAVESEEQKRRKKTAMGLADFAGTAYATGIVYVSRRFVEDRLDKKPVNPDPKQVNQLADVTKETIQEWFGDREIKPWQMMILLSLGIPIVMAIQSPKKPKAAEDPQKLKSVP